MAPLPPSSTVRWFLDYTTCGSNHTLLCRSVNSGTAAGASTAIDGFLTAIQSQVYEIAVTGFRKSELNSNVSVPVVWGGSPTYGTDDGPAEFGAYYLDFVGRSIFGTRIRVAVFGGRNASLGHDYRVDEAESTVVDDGIAALTADTDYFECIDGGDVLWNRYFNIGVNAYWRNKLR